MFAIYGSPQATEHLSFAPRTRGQVGQIVARSIASATTEPRSEYAVAIIERHTRELVPLRPPRVGSTPTARSHVRVRVAPEHLGSWLWP